MSDSIDCICLIVTGNVPVSIPFIRTLALSLPQACNSGVPVQCSASGVPLPSPVGKASAEPTPEVDPPSIEDDEPTIEKPTTAASPPKPSLLPKTTLQKPQNTSASSYISSFSSPFMLMLVALVTLFVDKSLILF
uniref:Bifunctional inhibitor/plant lipid transfer protein/seed storage helical domain-containing protein n=1 Tax=Solanum lycopersicum TaxID=4081 RepID=A0A3Q7I3V0_SOLLC